MSGSRQKLKNAPIVEAVLDVECDFAPRVDLKKLGEAASLAFRDTYPQERPQYSHHFRIEARQDAPVEQSMLRAVEAFRFYHEDGKQLVQIRKTGFSFNRLAPYSGFNDYLPEIRRTWEIFRDLAAPVLVRAVQLRYINRLQLPFKDGGVHLDEYFKNGPKLPEVDGLVFEGFLNQSVARDEATGYVVTTVLAAELPKDERLPVIFDNGVRATLKADPGDWGALETTLQSLRSLKNRVFDNTLSEQCLNLYR